MLVDPIADKLIPKTVPGFDDIPIPRPSEILAEHATAKCTSVIRNNAKCLQSKVSKILKKRSNMLQKERQSWVKVKKVAELLAKNIKTRKNKSHKIYNYMTKNKPNYDSSPLYAQIISKYRNGLQQSDCLPRVRKMD